MKRSSLIGHIAELLDLFRNNRQPADKILKEYYRKRGYLGSKDRRYISECFFGLLRNQALVEHFALQSLGFPLTDTSWQKIPSLALIAVFLVRVAHDDATSLRPDVAGLWNRTVQNVELDAFFSALLTALPPETQGLNPAARFATEYSLPEFIVSEWIDEYGASEAESLCRALNAPAPITIRVNTLRCTRDECRDALGNEGINAEPTLLSPVGLILSKRANVNALRTFRDGWFEMQDEGSQLISMLVRPSPGDLIVDACAGGGGKTLHLAAVMQNRGRILSIDSEQRRLESIQPRLQRAGVSIVEMLHSERDRDRIATMQGSASAVLIDAPCSGVGTFRRNPGSKMLATPVSVSALARTQSGILDRYATFVKPGGRLVYSTCTLLREENLDQIEGFMARHNKFTLRDAVAVLREQGVAVPDEGPYLTLWPQRTGTDGFFAAVMERRT